MVVTVVLCNHGFFTQKVIYCSWPELFHYPYLDHLLTLFIIYLFLHSFDAGDHTQGIMHAKHVLYYQTTPLAVTFNPVFHTLYTLPGFHLGICKFVTSI